jgi:uncharacterized protein YndB with AHSA1/START domain
MELIDFSRPGDTVIVERAIAAPPDKIWALWTDAKRMTAWMSFVNYQPRLGGRILLDQTAGATDADPRMIIFGRVAELAPQQRIAFSWRGFMEDLRVWPADTLVTLELRAAASGCTVRLSHSGFAAQEGWREPLYSAYHHCWVQGGFMERLDAAADGDRA